MHDQDQVLLINWLSISWHGMHAWKDNFQEQCDNSCWLLCVFSCERAWASFPLSFHSFICRLWQINSMQHVHTHAVSMLADERTFTVIQSPIDHLNGVAQLAPSGLSDHYYSYGCMDLILLPSMQLPAACIACVSRSGVCMQSSVACQRRVKERWRHRLPTHATVLPSHPIPELSCSHHLFIYYYYVCVCVWTLENRSAWHGCLFCSSMAKEEEGSK